MQQAISYKTWAKVAGGRGVTISNVRVVLGRKGCCMATVVKRLLLGLGVNPAIYELEGEILVELKRIVGNVKDRDFQFPTVFRGLDRVMATHIKGELVPILKEAGALCL